MHGTDDIIRPKRNPKLRVQVSDPVVACKQSSQIGLMKRKEQNGVCEDERRRGDFLKRRKKKNFKASEVSELGKARVCLPPPRFGVWSLAPTYMGVTNPT